MERWRVQLIIIISFFEQKVGWDRIHLVDIFIVWRQTTYSVQCHISIPIPTERSVSIHMDKWLTNDV